MYERGMPGSRARMRAQFPPTTGAQYWPPQVNGYPHASEYNMGYPGMPWQGPQAYQRDQQVPMPHGMYHGYSGATWGQPVWQQTVMATPYPQGMSGPVSGPTDLGCTFQDPDRPGSGAATPEELTMPMTPNFAAAASPTNQPSPLHFAALSPGSAGFSVLPAAATGPSDDSSLGQDIYLAVTRFLDSTDQGIPDSDGENGASGSTGGPAQSNMEEGAARRSPIDPLTLMFQQSGALDHAPTTAGVEVEESAGASDYQGWYRHSKRRQDSWPEQAEEQYRHADHRRNNDAANDEKWWQRKEDAQQEDNDQPWWRQLNSAPVREAVAWASDQRWESSWWEWESEGTSRGSAQKSTRKDSAAWAKAVRIKDSGQSIRVSMGNWSLTDADIEVWCEWFTGYLRSKKWDSKSLYAQDVDFSRNKLTSAGVRSLLQTLWNNNMTLGVLKLHHNKIESAEDMLGLFSDGNLRELHLSHNQLDNTAATELIKAAATARDENGVFRYPRKEAEGQSAPLWLRLEQNCTEGTGMQTALDMLKRKLKRRDGLICILDGTKGCTPHGCMVHPVDPPALHVMYSQSQRGYQAGAYEASSWEESADHQQGRGAKSRHRAEEWNWDGAAPGGKTGAKASRRDRKWELKEEGSSEQYADDHLSETSKSRRRRAAARQKKNDKKGTSTEEDATAQEDGED